MTRDEERKRIRWYLYKWGRYDELCLELQSELRAAYERIEGTTDPKTSSLTGMPGGGRTSDQTPTAAARYADMKDRMSDRILYLEEKLEKETRIYKAMDEAVSSLSAQEQRVLSLRYREEKNFQEIAKRTNYSKRGVENIAERAVDKLKKLFLIEQVF